MSGGLESKWLNLQNELEGLKDELGSLKETNKSLEKELKRFKESDVGYWKDRAEGSEEKLTSTTSDLIKLDQEERQCMDALVQVYTTIVETWNLKSNTREVASAIHVLQGFVIQRMLNRLSPGWHQKVSSK